MFFSHGQFHKRNVQRVFSFLIGPIHLLFTPWRMTSFWGPMILCCMIDSCPWLLRCVSQEDQWMLWSCEGWAPALIIQPETVWAGSHVSEEHCHTRVITQAQGEGHMKLFQHLWITHGPRNMNNPQAASLHTQSPSKSLLQLRTTHGLSRCELCWILKGGFPICFQLHWIKHAPRNGNNLRTAPHYINTLPSRGDEFPCM